MNNDCIAKFRRRWSTASPKLTAMTGFAKGGVALAKPLVTSGDIIGA